MLASLKAVLARPAKAAAKPGLQLESGHGTKTETPDTETAEPQDKDKPTAVEADDDEDSYFEESDDEPDTSPSTPSTGDKGGLDQVRHTHMGPRVCCLTVICLQPDARPTVADTPEPVDFDDGELQYSKLASSVVVIRLLVNRYGRDGAVHEGHAGWARYP